MNKKHLVDEMIIIREEMRNINNRIQTTNSSKIFECVPIQNRNEKIRKYCYQLVALRPKLFRKYFVSEQYIHELLNRMDYEKLLQISLKFIVKYLQNQEDEQSQINESTSPTNIKDVDRVTKIIKDIVSPIRTKIISQAQFFDHQLKSIHKSCQTLPSNQDTQSKNNFNLGIRQQSSILSSIQQDNLNSPKFNENIINAIDEISFERSSLKKDNQNMKQQFEQLENLQNQKLNQSQIRDQKVNYDISVITTPKQKELDNYKQTQNTSMNSSFKDTKRKLNNKSMLQLKHLEKLEDKRFPKKEVPYTMLSVDYVRKRRKTPEKNRGFNIITNY
ncbi:unnamed protein product [Paramecium primaurelia]|uniref:Uncharacterized protein n=1 Tax=Paramecium primaurelia TaxID=5886 RepID=A0A8S1QJQ5_PARPR|nr:unnamed protein product [Paramecium primaurelia]